MFAPATWIAAALTGVLLAAASPAHAAPRLSPTGLGAVRIGMDTGAATAALGGRYRIDDSSRTYACRFWSFSPTFAKASFTATGGRHLDLIAVYQRSVRSTRGIRVKDRLGKLQRRYGHRLHRAHYRWDTSGLTRYYDVYGRAHGRSTTLRFTVANDTRRVTSMVVGRSGVVRDHYECA